MPHLVQRNSSKDLVSFWENIFKRREKIVKSLGKTCNTNNDIDYLIYKYNNNQKQLYYLPHIIYSDKLKIISWELYKKYFYSDETRLHFRHFPSFRNFQKQFPINQCYNEAKTKKKGQKSNRNSLRKNIGKLISTNSQQLESTEKIIWREIVSSNGCIYYWNTKNNITQYEAPDEDYLKL